MTLMLEGHYCDPYVDVIADNWAVSRSSSEKAVDSSEASWDAVDDNTAWSPVSLTGDALLLLQELDDAPLRQVFATNKAGLYKITFRVYEFVRSSRNLHSLSLNMLYPLTATAVHFVQAAGSRLAVKDISVVPAAHSNATKTENGVDISIRVPPTKSLELKWRSIDAAEASSSAEGAEEDDDLDIKSYRFLKDLGEMLPAEAQLRAASALVIQLTSALGTPWSRRFQVNSEVCASMLQACCEMIGLSGPAAWPEEHVQTYAHGRFSTVARMRSLAKSQALRRRKVRQAVFSQHGVGWWSADRLG